MFGAFIKSHPEQFDFLLLPNFSMMAFTSCVEPLRAANRLAGSKIYDWHTFSRDGAPVEASNGVVVSPEGALENIGNAHAVMVCTGVGGESFNDPRVIRRLRELSRTGVLLGGICTGAIPLARAGLLNGYRCTIHWENVEGFVEEFPDLDTTATLFEVDRDRLTCSGGTAPLDMMINTIAKDHGDDLAIRVAELLLHNSVRHPHDMQRMPIQYRTGITHPKLLAVIAHMEAYVESPVSVPDLADSVGLSSRQLERLFKERLGKTPTRYYLDLRLQRARLLLIQTSMSVLQIAVATGFTSASHFAHCYGEHFGKSPRAERAQLERVPK